MLNKIFGNNKINNLFLSKKLSYHGRAPDNPSGPAEKGSRALKIIHAGGRAEFYYMAIPAARIIDKYPSFILTRPDIFHRPWDSIVQPEEILVPGQKYYVVPRHTVKKLRHRITKSSGLPLTSKSSLENSARQKDSISISISKSSIMVKPGTKAKARNRNHHVKFLDIENKKESSSGSVPRVRKKEIHKTQYSTNDFHKTQYSTNEKSKNHQMNKKLKNHQMNEKRRARIDNSWEPSLNAIHENINEY